MIRLVAVHDDPSAPLDAGLPDACRQFMQAYYTGVTIVTAVDGAGRPHGMTCTSLSSVTLAPPTLLVCLGLNTGTFAAITDCGSFAVNILEEDARSTAELFATPASDRFERVSWLPTQRTGNPWLAADAYALAECSLVRTVIVGDHAVVIGEVLHVERRRGAPLLYGMRTYRRRG